MGGGAGAEPSRSASTICASNASGYHILKIDGYSRTLATPTQEYISSLPFTVGGHRWYIRYYPNGDKLEAKDYVSLYLDLYDTVARAKARFKFRFVGDVVEEPLALGGLRSFSKAGGSSNDDNEYWGYSEFMKREDLEKSEHLRDDSFAVQCDVLVVTKEFRTEEAPEATAGAAIISVPPSDLHQHLGSLLRTEKGADVVFDVAGETFAAHRWLLAARSPVFSAQLFGAMKESGTGGVVHIEDMEPRVFKALLYFIYTDLLFPKTEKEIKTKTKKMKLEEGHAGDDDDEEEVLSQHLLVAADKCNLERLKLLCEKKLCEYINAGNVATILALAEQHHCHGLKKVCFHFLRSPANLRAAMASNGFKHLSKSCPSVMEELVAMLGT